MKTIKILNTICLKSIADFLKILQNKRVTKASDELHFTQPVASILLKKCQDRFEIPLTEVVARKIYITGSGRDIAEAAEKIINQVYAMYATNYKTPAYKGSNILSHDAGRRIQINMPHFITTGQDVI